MMRALRRAWHRLVRSVRPDSSSDRELAEEIASHIELFAADRIRRGVAPAEAQRQARLRFGSVPLATEQYRHARGVPLLDDLRQDLRYAVRGLRRDPGFAVVALLSLAIGIGANTAIFSLVNAVLLRPLAFAAPNDLYRVHELTSVGRNRSPVNPVHARAWATDSPSIEHLAIMSRGRVRISSGGEPASVSSVDVSPDLFPLFGVVPIVGRGFRSDEDQPGRDQVVVISEALWRSRFNADPALVGQSILIDDAARQVVGIMPSSFLVPYSDGMATRFDVFRPLVLGADELARVDGNFNYAAVIRVRAGRSADQARAEIDVVQARFQRPIGLSVGLRARLTSVHEFVTSGARVGLLMLAAAVGAVLLIVCVNLANLLLARMASRSHEGAIRTALGASRGRQFRQALTESLVLSVMGGALGIALAYVALQVLVSSASISVPRIEEVRLDFTVLAVASALTLMSALLFGVLPAWTFTRHHPQDALRASGRTSTDGGGRLRLRKVLVGTEVALSATLLVVAGLLTSSLAHLLNVEKGFDADRVLTMTVDLGGSRYAVPNERGLFFDRLLAKVSAINGVHDAGAITQLPVTGQTWNDPIYLEHAPRDEWHAVDNRYTSPGYFPAMQVRVLSGRLFDDGDRSRGVAVLSQKAAQLLWPGDANPVGRMFMGEDDKIKTLVGIVADVRATLAENPPATAYYPYWQREPFTMSLVVRTRPDVPGVAASIRNTLREADPQLAIAAVEPMVDVVDRTVAERAFQRTLIIAFAVVALFVASLGIYGVVSYAVERRRTELGIRLALGAQRAGLIGMVIRQGMLPVVIGLCGGVIAALSLGQVIRGLLFGIQPSDPLTIAGVSGVLLVVGTLACFIPARRVANADALQALKAE